MKKFPLNDPFKAFCRTEGYPIGYNDCLVAYLRDRYSKTGGSINDLMALWDGVLTPAGPPPVGFVPTDIAGGSLWLDASDAASITHSGGSVSQWSDKFASANHLTQATAGRQPTTNVNTQNSLNTMYFDGTEFLEKAVFVPTASLSVFMVAKVLATSSTIDALISMDAASNDWQVDSSVSGQFKYRMNSNIVTPTTASVADYLGVASTTSFHFNNVDNTLKLNIESTLEYSAVYSPPMNLTQVLRLCANRPGTLYVRADISEVIMYNAVLTPAEIASVETYLSTKWNT